MAKKTLSLTEAVTVRRRKLPPDQIMRAVAGKYKDSELYQTKKMLDNVPDNSVLLMDKRYHCAKLLIELENNGKKFIALMKSKLLMVF